MSVFRCQVFSVYLVNHVGQFKPGLICVPWLVIFQHGMYDNLLHALVKICKEEGPLELYRGLAPSLIGVVPYAAINYCSYDTLRKTYRRVTKKEHIGNLETLLMGSIAGAVASTATFPLEVARKQMQVMSRSGFFIFFVSGSGWLGFSPLQY